MRVGAGDARVQFRARADRFRCPHIAVIDVDQRAPGKISVHDHLEDVVVETGSGEIPVVVEALVEEVEAVEALHPADPDLHVQIAGVVIHAVTLLGIHELVHPDGIAVGHHRPVVDLAVHSGNLRWPGIGKS